MDPSSLASAPPDIILSITEHLDLASLLQLRLLCRALNTHISPLALRNIAFRLLGAADERSQERLEGCSQPLPAVYQCARHLTVKISFWEASYHVTEAQVVALCNTIEQLEGLVSFKLVWTPGGYRVTETNAFVVEIPEKLVEAVFKATGGALKKLIFKPGERDTPLPKRLGEFRGLRVLGVDFDKYRREGCNESDKYGQEMGWYQKLKEHKCLPKRYKDVLKELVRNNPEVQDLQVRGDCVIDFHDASELFFGEGKQNNTEEQTPKLRNLTLAGVKFSGTHKAHGFPFVHLQSLEVPTRYSVNPLDNLWSALRVAETALKTLRTHQISLALISYLNSYIGLQHLIIENIEKSHPSTDPKVVAMFFNDVLPQHATSLTKLRIGLSAGADYVKGWSFDPALWMPALHSLVALESLHLHPGDTDAVLLESQDEDRDGDDSNDSDEEGDGEDIERLVRVYQEVLDHIESLPCLTTLGIIWPEQEWDEERRGYIGWYWESVETISKVAKKLRNGNGIPKELVLYQSTYEAEEDEPESGQFERGWRYTLVEESNSPIW
ncbi:hypothetical protein AX16_001156 [Volvariella volvacea WC 439]|nr:hypothetical protein AX16_001156 [Volvariella volvacea WC 439]